MVKPVQPLSVTFLASVRARFLLAALVLLIIPAAGWMFVRELSGYLREAQVEVTTAAARLTAASLSDRPGLRFRQNARLPGAETPDPARTENADTPPPDAERDRVIALFAASDAGIAAGLGARYQPDGGVERILAQGVAPGQARSMRAWAVDLNGNVRGLAGALHATADPTRIDLWRQMVLRWMLIEGAGGIRAGRAGAVVDNVADSGEAVLAQAERALLGQSNAEWRVQQDDRLAVLSVAEPIWQGDSIIAAVVIEQSDSGPRALAGRATETVIATSLVVCVVAFATLLWFAFNLARRLSRLQGDANAAIDADGRVKGSIRTSKARDEIGALTRTLEAMIVRQAGYNQYLEKLAGRLSHELRTPVAVVRSSLDNLRSTNAMQGTGNAGADDAQTYLARADEGVARLSTIISRMSEATQLEHILKRASPEPFELGALVEGAVAGYRLAFPGQEFTYQKPETPISLTGAPDAVVQMLDKLVANAADFAREGTAIEIRASREGNFAQIAVENLGPLLPVNPSAQSALFDSMVSAREGTQSRAQQDIHLGLGLYIARLVAEHHGGNISARNRASNDGVVFTVTLPIK